MHPFLTPFGNLIFAQVSSINQRLLFNKQTKKKKKTQNFNKIKKDAIVRFKRLLIYKCFNIHIPYSIFSGCIKQIRLCQGHRWNGRRAISSDFGDSKILDIVQAPYDCKTFCSNSHKSDGSCFGNAVGALFSSERHRAATGRTSSGDRTAPVQTPVGLLAAIQLPSSHRTIDVRFMLSFAFNHSFEKRRFIWIAENFW